MNFRSVLPAMLVATLLIGSANAHMTVESSNAPTAPLVPGEEYSVDIIGYVHCSVLGPENPNDGSAIVEYKNDQVLTMAIVEHEVNEWLQSDTINETLHTDRCEPVTEPNTGAQYQGVHLYGPQVIMPNTITFSVDERAPAFETFTFQPGAIGETNEGGSFDVEIAYNPAFTAPTHLTFDAVEGGATATIPLTMTANADSIFNFEVTMVMFDGEHVEGYTAHIQDTLEVATAIATEEGTVTKTVDLHFGAPGGESHEGMDHGDEAMAMEGEGDAMEGMDHGDHGDDADAGHFHWETAEAKVAITLAAKDDDTLVSEPRELHLVFTNADADTMPHEEEEMHEEEGSNFLPGFELVGLVGALGAVAALRRRD